MKLDLASIKLGLRPDEAAALIGSEELFRQMVGAKWIKPVIQRHKLTLYDRGHLTAVWLRILAGESPNPAARHLHAQGQ